MDTQKFNPLRWKRSYLIGALIAFIAIWFLFIDTYSLYTRVDLNFKKDELIQKTDELQQQTRELEEKIQELENNPDLLEKIAREEYGMRKPDEKVYRIKSDD
ncbi:FtsB family cell division protein [Rhodohalobacter halophilus]|uniref:FtsB family cell division protein n=1 Tax=Rhodohalobacter halophilus TaxID=1812810 RepID=UPI00083F9327|nr:septum formation initiator family protein [Rhodohalobacter halophilus]